MNLAQLRKLVDDTKNFPDSTKLVLVGQQRTYDEVRGIEAVQALVFPEPSSQCPLGAALHRGTADFASFGCGSEAELMEKARLETVLEVY